jgi:glutamine synthetase
MAKPFTNDIGSSCHIHASLWTKESDAPISYDGKAHGHMSKKFGSFVAGLIAGGREYCWLMAPTINSYRRFRKASFAPVQLVVGDDNRTCGYRLVGREASFRVESRIPGADANPYLALAATLASGLDGIDRQLDAPALYTRNAYDNVTLPRVPSTMRDAVDCFAASSPARAALGDEVHAHLVNFACQELDAFEQETVTDWEMMRYFERI